MTMHQKKNLGKHRKIFFDGFLSFLMESAKKFKRESFSLYFSLFLFYLSFFFHAHFGRLLRDVNNKSILILRHEIDNFSISLIDSSRSMAWILARSRHCFVLFLVWFTKLQSIETHKKRDFFPLRQKSRAIKCVCQDRFLEEFFNLHARDENKHTWISPIKLSSHWRCSQVTPRVYKLKHSRKKKRFKITPRG